MKRRKICFAASSGGHLEEVLLLRSMLQEECDSVILTEKTSYAIHAGGAKIYSLHPVNRKEKTWLPWMFVNTWISFRMFLKEKPDAVITTGALAVIPVCLFAKLFRKKLIFMETFAVITEPSATGRFLYRFADRFYIQWESLKESYPGAVYLGGIYK